MRCPENLMGPLQHKVQAILLQAFTLCKGTKFWLAMVIHSGHQTDCMTIDTFKPCCFLTLTVHMNNPSLIVHLSWNTWILVLKY